MHSNYGYTESFASLWKQIEMENNVYLFIYLLTYPIPLRSEHVKFEEYSDDDDDDVSILQIQSTSFRNNHIKNWFGKTLCKGLYYVQGELFSAFYKLTTSNCNQ